MHPDADVAFFMTMLALVFLIAHVSVDEWPTRVDTRRSPLVDRGTCRAPLDR